MSIQNAIRHLHTVNKHRFLVMLHCFRAGIPLQGITHDLTKYYPSEFLIGAKYYQGNRSPNDAERKDKGYSTAWMHHKGRNKHHFEYWTDYNTFTHTVEPVEMPEKYAVEMFCDRVAACKVYKKKEYTDRSPLEYLQGHGSKVPMHQNTMAFLTELLTMLAEKGEKETFRYIRHLDK
ncbi:MAG: catalase [Clostridia bacterium]|nr:catalase [Clostridia bacterium]MBR6511941.1 catalase [Clostridia bacterium]